MNVECLLAVILRDFILYEEAKIHLNFKGTKARFKFLNLYSHWKKDKISIPKRYDLLPNSK